MSRRTPAAWAAPLAVALIWGVNVPVMKAGIAHVDPFFFNALRLTFSVLALGLAARLEGGSRATHATPWRVVLGFALLTSLLYQVLFLTGMARTSASHTGFLIASGPLWTAVLARLVGVERPARRAWLGLAVAFVGTALVASSASEGRAATRVGNALVLASMLAWAIGTVWSRPILRTFSATRLAYLSTLVALPGHWLLGWSSLRGAPARLPGAMEWAGIVYSGVFSTGVAYVLWNRSVQRLGPARTSAYSNLVPLVSLAVAWILLGDRPGALQLAGGGLIVLGLASWRALGASRRE